MKESLTRVLGGSRVGKAHQLAGLPNQDSFGWAVGEEYTVLVVADGAGSRPRSREGSRKAVEAVLAHKKPNAQNLGSDWVHGCFLAAQHAIEDLAIELSCERHELATTLAVAAVTEEYVAIGQLGDSLVVVENGSRTRLVQPEIKSEYANETIFLSSGRALEEVRVEVTPAPEVSALALSTDGLRLNILELPAMTPYGPFFEDAFNYGRDLDSSSIGVRKFLEGLDDQTGDDLTLLLAVRGRTLEQRVISSDAGIECVASDRLTE